uniref:Transcription factor Adf-1 n=1 Tax=Lygus hesperus TaxID=30085 RepID=A0A0A9Y108_LYGHE
MPSHFEEALILEVKKYKVLYDMADRFYYDTNAKDNAWQEISERLDTEAEACKKKWQMLREGFRKAKLRRKTVDGQEAKPWKPWKYEKEMSFLDVWKDTKDQLSNVPPSHEVEDTEDGDSVFNDDDTQSTTFSTQDTTPYSESGSSVTVHLPDTKRQKKQAICTSEVLQQYLEKKEERRDTRESGQSKNDHIRQFFASSESIFRMLPAEVQVDARVEITQLLAKYEKQALLLKRAPAPLYEPPHQSPKIKKKGP